MSSFNVEGGLITEDPVRITGNTATTVYSATGRTVIASIIVCETNAGTPALTIQIHNGTTGYYLRKAVAMTAGTPFIFNEPFVLPALYTLKVTSGSATGDMDVFITRGIGAAPGMLRQGA